ncbi:MAG: hypoxanthine phosphoribosyltransferase [candidate division WOR-3 bacterium]|nr:hypoxanthine phosphoribosyltransferase [candidate division WOR-3 bacterium]MCX7757182.1 hypoxanthine phosphoribosyltransferase [candidate division WOR-3 bacterium]MDW7988230.1 hypoxanthine phosphoribosyltransferase [candidate division WOR-3 bacterium]
MKNVKLCTLLTEEEIKKKIEELGRKISEDYSNSSPLLIGVLKGAWIFMADLVRAITVPVRCDFLQVSSYGQATESSGVVKIITDLKSSITNEDVILVEDIVDTGLTLRYIIDYLSIRHPKSIKICALLDKPERHKINIKIDYLGFTVPNKFVVGYGIDYQELYRNLPYIGYVELEE